MPRYHVIGTGTISKLLGMVDAASPEEAIEKVANDPDLDVCVSFCHQCAREVGDSRVDLDDYHAEEVPPII